MAHPAIDIVAEEAAVDERVARANEAVPVLHPSSNSARPSNTVN
jgi:hypothetical protein